MAVDHHPIWHSLFRSATQQSPVMRNALRARVVSSAAANMAATSTTGSERNASPTETSRAGVLILPDRCEKPLIL